MMKEGTMEKYSISIAWSDEDQAYIATVPEFRNLSVFGSTYEEALKEAEIVLEGYIESFKSENTPLPEPNKVSEYSGQTRLRMPRDLHRALAIGAQKQGVSLNTHMVTLLSMSYTVNTILSFAEQGRHICVTCIDVKSSGKEETISNLRQVFPGNNIATLIQKST